MRSFVALLFLASATALACGRSVDPNRVVLFVDANASFLEGQAAKRAACARGESFLWLPGEAASRSRQQWNVTLARLNRQLSNTQPDDPQWEKLMDEYSRYSSTMPEVPEFNAESVRLALNSLASRGAAVTAATFSGHDGGGAIGGVFGFIDKSEFAEAFQGAYEARPDLAQQFQTALMWGCYTATRSEVSQWRGMFPGLRVMGGFYDSGPSNERPASYGLLESMLINSGRLVRQCNEADLRRAVNQLTHFNTTYAAISVSTCNGDFYSARTPQGSIWERSTEQTCDPETVQTLSWRAEQYMTGNQSIPENTSNSPLRNLYAEARSLPISCNTAGTVLDGDRLGLLRFYRAVVDNFLNVFAQDVAAFEGALAAMTPMGERVSALAPDGVAALLRTGNRRSLAQYLNRLNDLQDVLVTSGSPHADLVSRFTGNMQRYLYDLDPSCMNFLEWHEAVPGQLPSSRCGQ
jgi:hypothetical protein